MDCKICDKELQQETFLTHANAIAIGYYSIVLRGLNLEVCADCFSAWTKLLEFLFVSFREKKKIDEEIVRKLLEM